MAMQNLQYKDTILEYKDWIKTCEDSESLIAYATLLDHQALNEPTLIHRYKMEFKAKKIYQRVLKSNVHNADALSGIGRIYWHRSSPKAIAYYKKALIEDPKNSTRMANLANAYTRINKLDDAQKLYIAALETNKAPFGIYLNFFKNIDIQKFNKETVNKYFIEMTKKIHAMPISETKKIAEEQLEEIKKRIKDAV